MSLLFTDCSGELGKCANVVHGRFIPDISLHSHTGTDTPTGRRNPPDSRFDGAPSGEWGTRHYVHNASCKIT